jgi:diguanylate cyclase (GGDEF)-like protein
MTDLINNYVAVDVMCAISLIILAHASWNNVILISEMKRHFSVAAYITIAVIAAQVGCVFFENVIAAGRVPIIIANAIGFSFSPFIAVVLSNVFSMEKGKIVSLLTIPAWVNFVLVISSPWTGLIFSVSNNNSYFRGPLFVVYVAAYLCSYVMLIIESIKAIKHYQCHTKSTFEMLLVFTFAGTSVQVILPDVHVSWLCITLSLTLYYAYFCELSETQDAVTGLLNRSVYDQHSKSLDHSGSGTVIILDLDNFKQINDLYGHQLGDSCLRTVGRLIKNSFVQIGFCYRIGGDEFCVICRTTDEQTVKDALESFHRKIDKSRKNNNGKSDLPLVSSGYSVFHSSGEGFAAAVKEADAQMYCFKNTKKLDLDKSKY